MSFSISGITRSMTPCRPRTTQSFSAALLYALAGTWLTDWMGRPLVRLNFDQQRYEAAFRCNLVRFRENAEGVALYHGKEDELRTFRERFGSIIRNWWGIMRQQKRITWLTAGYGQAAVVFPLIVVAPRYFRDQILLGGLMQTAAAFGQVQDSLSLIVSSYTDIAAWRAVVERLAGFQRTLELAHIQAATEVGIHHVEGEWWGTDRRRRRARPSRRSAADCGREPLAQARRECAPLRIVGPGQEHPPPCHRRNLALRPWRDPCAVKHPPSLSPTEALPADRDATGGGELSDAGWRCGRHKSARGARGGRAAGASR